MDQQLDTMLYHTGRYSSLLARRLQGQEAAQAAAAAARTPSQEPAEQVLLGTCCRSGASAVQGIVLRRVMQPLHDLQNLRGACGLGRC